MTQTIAMLYAKIHNATVTKCALSYEGSMGIDQDYLDAVGLYNGQQIDVLNANNAERFTTYIIAEPRGSKIFGIYGPAARKAQVGDKVVIIAYGQVAIENAATHTPKVIILDDNNAIKLRK